jgi:hypothetical protein
LGEYWFAEEVLEPIDRGQGIQIEIHGKRFALDESGDWKPSA